MVTKKSDFLKDYQYAAIVIAAGIFGALVLIFLAVIPSWKKLDKTSHDLTVAQEKQEMLAVRLETLKGLKEKEAELKEKNAKVLAALPTGKDVSRLFVEFESIATQSGLTVKEVTETSGTTTTGTPTSSSGLIVPVTYEVSTLTPDYSSLKMAMTKFEAALRMLSTSGLDATKTSNDFTAKFTITTYMRRGEQ